MAATLVELLGPVTAEAKSTGNWDCKDHVYLTAVRLRHRGFVKNSLGSGPNTFQVYPFLTKYQAALPTVIACCSEGRVTHLYESFWRTKCRCGTTTMVLLNL